MESKHRSVSLLALAAVVTLVWSVRVAAADAPAAAPSPVCSVFTTVVGRSSTGCDDGAPGEATASEPTGLSFDAIRGELFFSDSPSDWGRKGKTLRVYKVAADVTSTLAGSCGSGGFEDGTGSDARFDMPMALAVVEGTVYVSDSASCAIRALQLATLEVTTFAGGAGQVSCGFLDSVGTAARLDGPEALVASSATLWVADSNNNVVRAVDLATAAVTTLAGATDGSNGFDDGIGTSALFNYPVGLALDAGPANVLYVMDGYNYALRVVSLATLEVTTVAGGHRSSGYEDGYASDARFALSMGISLDAASGLVIVSDTYNQVIRSVNPSTTLVQTLVGKHNDDGYANGVGSRVQFKRPSLAVPAGNGTFYIADSGNNRVRFMTCDNLGPVAVSATPSPTTTPSQGSTQSQTPSPSPSPLETPPPPSPSGAALVSVSAPPPAPPSPSPSPSPSVVAAPVAPLSGAAKPAALSPAEAAAVTVAAVSLFAGATGVGAVLMCTAAQREAAMLAMYAALCCYAAGVGAAAGSRRGCGSSPRGSRSARGALGLGVPQAALDEHQTARARAKLQPMRAAYYAQRGAADTDAAAMGEGAAAPSFLDLRRFGGPSSAGGAAGGTPAMIDLRGSPPMDTRGPASAPSRLGGGELDPGRVRTVSNPLVVARRPPVSSTGSDQPSVSDSSEQPSCSDTDSDEVR